MIKRLWASIKAFFYTPVVATESQPKENTVKLTLVSIITSMLANGLAANTVQATLTDNAGVAQPGASVAFNADNGSTVNMAAGITDANGQITVSLVSLTAGPATLSALATDGTKETIQVYFVAVPATAAPVAEVTSPLDAEKSAFAKLVAFVESGVENFGSEAEAELVALAKKYL